MGIKSVANNQVIPLIPYLYLADLWRLYLTIQGMDQLVCSQCPSQSPYHLPLPVMTCFGQTSGHRQSAAVITDGHGRLGVMSLGRHNY